MSYRQDIKRAQEATQAGVSADFGPLKMPFTQTVKVAFEDYRAEYSSGSERRAEERFFGDRNRELEGMLKSGEIPNDVMEQNRTQTGYNNTNGMPLYTPDYHALAQWSNDNLGTTFDVDDTEMKQVMAEERNERRRRLERASLTGQAVGMMGAAVTDPEIAASMLIGAPLGAGRGIVLTGLRMGAIEAGIAATAEVPIQYQAMRFAERLDKPYTLEDAVTNVLMASGATFALATPLAMGGRALQIRAQNNADFALQQKLNELEQEADEVVSPPSQWEAYVSEREMPVEIVASRGDNAESPYLLADGRIIGTSQDHTEAIENYYESMGVTEQKNYEDFAVDAGAIRFSYWQEPNGQWVAAVQTFGSQKLTGAQANTLRQLSELSEGEVKVIVGVSPEGSGQTNPQYMPPENVETSIARLGVVDDYEGVDPIKDSGKKLEETFNNLPVEQQQVVAAQGMNTLNDLENVEAKPLESLGVDDEAMFEPFREIRVLSDSGQDTGKTFRQVEEEIDAAVKAEDEKLQKFIACVEAGGV